MKRKKIEAHIHTNISNDSILTNLFLLFICKLKKINVIILTNHNSMKNIFKTKKYFLKHNVLVIPGEEIFTTDGEIIGLYLNEEIKAGLSAKETILEIKKQGGLVYVPHPYDLKRRKSVLNENVISECANDIDLIEIHNGRNYCRKYSEVQKKISEKYNIQAIVGSDAHSIFELGRNYMISNIDEDITKENFVKIIRNSQFKCKECIKWIHTYTKFVKLLKLLLKGDLSGICKIIKKRCK